ncbi:MAG: hypothetical protein QGD88_05250 [Anaerolineae bacterium]|nr:hypothetical protein [Anaerolineae bacterium]MDK1080868.1 hypothetical protein [Anaerolineae bacterium]
MEIGIISPGQRLYLGKEGKFEGKLRPDASIICEDLVGSIHKLAKALLKAPANGWEQWFYVDKGGQKQPIDNLRKLYRKIEKNSI